MNAMQEQPSSPRALPKFAAIDESQSTAFKIARVICIIFMTSTHAWPGSDRILAADQPEFLHFLLVVIVDSLGRASVPLLSLISGVLLVHSFAGRSPASIMEGKFKTLIIPMIVWSIPLVIIAFAKPLLTGEPTPQWSTLDWLNAFLAITEPPANGPLHFLREIFVMAAYGCIILSVYRWNRWAGIFLAIFVCLLEQKPGGFLILRNQIAFMYIAGMLLALEGRARWRPGGILTILCLGVFTYCEYYKVLDPYSQDIFFKRASDLIPRVAMSIIVWKVSYFAATNLPKVRSASLWLEPHIFTVFCAHFLTIKAFTLLAWSFNWNENSTYYIFILIMQLVTFVVVGVILSHLLKSWPWLRGKSGSRKAKVDKAPIAEFGPAMPQEG